MKKVSLGSLAALLCALVPACSDGSGTPSPRITTIPQQSSAGGSTFTLDLATYVTSDAGSVYSVTSGGGSFTGSVYSHIFDTLGTYTVQFDVKNGQNQTKSGSFQVKVSSSELAIVKIGEGYWLYDLNTAHLVERIMNDGRTKTFKTALTDGSFLLEVSQSGNTDLWLFDPNVPELTVLGESSNDEVYLAKTTGNVVFFRTGPTNALQLWSYDKLRDFELGITSGIGTGNDTRSETNPVVNTSDWVLFEASLNQGPKDIWSWDLTKAQAALVSDAATNETVAATLTDGSYVLTRVGAGGETDLYRYTRSGGLVEIGADLDGATPFTESKTYAGATSSGDVVFTTSNGSDTDLYVWLAGTGQTKTISATANAEAYCGVLSNGDVIYAITASGNVSLYAYDLSAETSSGAFTGSGTATTAFHAVLANDAVVFTASTGDLRTRSAAGAFADPNFGTAETFVAATSGGDYVVTITGTGADLRIWDESAGSIVTIAALAGDDVYGGVASDGRILFVNSDGTTQTLKIWNPVGSTTTDIKASTSAISVAAVVAATVN